ncbi:hypothetical protein [Ensifer canadensis]
MDRDGQWVDCAHNRRCISADLSIPSARSRSACWSCRKTSKFEPLMAALKGGFASHLVVTTSMARRVMERWSRDGLGKAGATTT